jgi:hypothetical protein
MVGDIHHLSKGDITCKRPRTTIALANLTISIAILSIGI